MLVLSRKIGQDVIIGVPGADGNTVEIVVRVIESRDMSGKVRLGFDAPADVVIHRREIWDQVKGGGR